jgi:hypothetical protein
VKDEPPLEREDRPLVLLCNVMLLIAGGSAFFIPNDGSWWIWPLRVGAALLLATVAGIFYALCRSITWDRHQYHRLPEEKK